MTPGIFLLGEALICCSGVCIQSAGNAFISPWCLNSLIPIQKWITESLLCVQTYAQYVDNCTEKQKKRSLFRLLSWRLSLCYLKCVIRLQVCQTTVTSLGEMQGKLWPFLVLAGSTGGNAALRASCRPQLSLCNGKRPAVTNNQVGSRCFGVALNATTSGLPPEQDVDAC